MKLISFCVLFLFVNVTPELETIRQRYVSAAQSEQSADSFYDSLQNVKEGQDATLLAYKAASVVLKAKYTKGFFSKTRLFNRGTDLLEETIEKSPNNYEARLIRLNIQDNVPWITGYKSEIKEDKAFLMSHYKEQPTDLKLFTKKYIKQSDAFSDKEKLAFN
ncbi:hypothetical protein [Flavobacterium litorale]|uniref:Uncharacterized protein n=1 Tax=Flavobacterium litorale TaxID=2856519 RepID=A0ABX8V7B1_9FLAO|nr:hypothetical protein [Flavobacterium litorale]QYJ68734.1 hypothetical protein K1I41_02305 [Flavobacterium litorale]